MPPVLKFYHMQPSEFWALDSDELLALSMWKQKYEREAQKAAGG